MFYYFYSIENLEIKFGKDRRLKKEKIKFILFMFVVYRF